MAQSALEQRTYQPDDREELGRVHDFLVAHEAAGREVPEPRYLLAGAAAHDQVEIPESVYRVLLQVVEAMQQGRAVTVSPRSQSLTTQQAADLIGISRPTLIKLLDQGELNYQRAASSHRRLELRDVLQYMERRREQQYAALAAMSMDIDEDDDLEETLGSLQRARALVAGRRRARREWVPL